MGLEEYIYKFLFSFFIILIAARLGGEVAERYLKQPPVLGELIAGIIISPYALGLLINDPIILHFGLIEGEGLGFPIDGKGFIPFIEPITGEPATEFNPMEIISHIAVICLLFVAGVETDVRSFLKQGLTGALAALGGVIFPFLFGYLVIMWLYPGASSIEALFMGAVLTATSIGITVRILMEMGRLQTREGTTILVAAVIDDIIGLVILSVVNSMAKTGGEVNITGAILTAVIGFAVWFALLMIGVRFHKHISRFTLKPFEKSGTMPIVAILIGFLVAYLVTLVDLHPVVGAYVAGLMFASTAEKETIVEKTRPIMLFLAPFFFCYLGMQVDCPLLAQGWMIALILIVLATIGKIIGCYIPARFQGKLSHNSAMIVGVGMVPRGEVGLIVAGAGLMAGAIDLKLFGVAVAVSIVTTLITPTMLKPFFKKAPPLTAEPATEQT